MITCAVYLRPCGPFSSRIASDTLFGAMCWGLQALGANLKSLFPNGPDFAVSSAFPVRLGAPRLRFYPRPLTFDLSFSASQPLIQSISALQKKSPKVALKDVTSNIKRLQKIAYLSEDVFKQVTQGTLTPSSVIEDWVNNGGLFVQVGNLLLSKSNAAHWTLNSRGDCQPLWVETETQHNQIDRITGSTGEGLLFYEPQLRFSAEGGFWVLVCAKDQSVVDKQVIPALRYLADTGLGGNRTSGYGCFDRLETEDLANLPQAGANGNAWMALSRYLPKEAEMQSGQPLAYRLTSLWPRREQKFAEVLPGQTSAPIYKRRIRVFEPGSVFRPAQMAKDLPAWYGDLAMVVKENEGSNPVYQCGRTIPIRLRVVEETQ